MKQSSSWAFSMLIKDKLMNWFSWSISKAMVSQKSFWNQQVWWPGNCQFFVRLLASSASSFHQTDPSAPFMAYTSWEAAVMDYMVIIHCRPCDYCSIMEIIKAFVMMRKTLQGDCGSRMNRCLKDDCMKVELRDDCHTCWVENMDCDTKPVLHEDPAHGVILVGLIGTP